jgi:hypothetical protein
MAASHYSCQAHVSFSEHTGTEIFSNAPDRGVCRPPVHASYGKQPCWVIQLRRSWKRRGGRQRHQLAARECHRLRIDAHGTGCEGLLRILRVGAYGVATYLLAIQRASRLPLFSQTCTTTQTIGHISKILKSPAYQARRVCEWWLQSWLCAEQYLTWRILHHWFAVPLMDTTIRSQRIQSHRKTENKEENPPTPV